MVAYASRMQGYRVMNLNTGQEDKTVEGDEEERVGTPSEGGVDGAAVTAEEPEQGTELPEIPEPAVRHSSQPNKGVPPLCLFYLTSLSNTDEPATWEEV
ncbi:hypothetical protein JRQ81_000908 [Phrynocephalus forsythii]|uniref:Uncharacterized protein n=1 Tax=Phrynocephalus forsythii TaxID=171643 RepID=A0A9Q1B7G3_9SAUR|nr:hypothetical protein JRQ81_000908 [Phrynocephalus forsythii]